MIDVPELVAAAPEEETEETQVLSEQTILHAYAIDTPVANEKLVSSLAVEVAESSESTLSFTLDDERMVNLYVEGIDQRNISLTLNGAPLNKPGGYYANKGGLDKAESISLRLTAGTYTVTITDETDYTESIESGSFSPLVQYEMLPYRSSEIIGAISIPESSKVMPVSLRVAEFVGDQRKAMNDVQELDTSKPVWVVVHGRGDSETRNNMNFLAQSLFNQGQQVVTLDWNLAASDNGLILGALSGANWIASVGEWSANQLKSLGFTGDKILIPGHSWGSLVAYEIAAQYKYGASGNGFGVQAIVAMDTPLDPLPNTYPVHNVVFNDVSRVSWALKSSAFGSDDRSNTASMNFDIIPPSEIYEDSPLMPPINKELLDLSQAYFAEHGYAVSYFANLVSGSGDSSVQSALDIHNLISGQLPSIPIDTTAPEGLLPITLQEATGPNGTYWQAVPTILSNDIY